MQNEMPRNGIGLALSLLLLLAGLHGEPASRVM
jgi:hypothetical protein